MERDSHRTFREIHGSMENLVSSVNDILEKALVEVVDDDAPLNLRFITPYQLSTDWPMDENCSEYALTLPGELPLGQEYISVSYTWAHSQEIDASKPISDYRIKDRATPDAPFRSINCPTMVFHRAWYFARARGIPYVWIDQECIYQDNTEDKERHLQIMDKIYEKIENEDSAVEDGIQELDPDTRMYWEAMVATTKKIKIWELDLDKPIAEALRKMGVIDEFD
ncbi:unnamed protein product [Alternaria alternata]